MTTPQTQTHLPATGFVRLKVILEVFPVSKSTWWAGIQDGRFPKPVKLSTRITAWRVEEIRQLILTKSNPDLLAENLRLCDNEAAAAHDGKPNHPNDN